MRISGMRVKIGFTLWLGLLLGVAGFSPDMVAQDQSGSGVIRGAVRSPDGTSLYGIFVKARGEGTNYQTSVITDAEGNYELPPLPVGTYQVAVGTEWSERVQLTASGARQDFSVTLGTGFMNQTTGTSWFKVIPGAEADKALITDRCIGCHMLSRLINYTPRTPDGWAAIVQKMNSIDTIGIPLKPGQPTEYELGGGGLEELTQALARTVKPEYKEKYIMEALVRPTGAPARAVFTEYDLPRTFDFITGAAPDSKGIIWYVGSYSNVLGELDPRTGQFREWPYPVEDADLHDMNIDAEDNVWPSAPGTNQITRFDPRTNEFTNWTIPDKFVGTQPHTQAFDSKGNLWVTMTRGSVVKLDPRTGAMEEYPSPIDPAQARPWPYGLVIDHNDTTWYTEHAANKIGKLEPTGEFTLYSPPTEDGGARRLDVDSKGRLWFTQSDVDKIGMMNPVTETITEYDIGIPGGLPYFVRVDRLDKVWFNLTNSNMLGVLDPDTEKFEFYLQPTPDAFGRDASFDYSVTPPAIVYGSATSPRIVRMYVRNE